MNFNQKRDDLALNFKLFTLLSQAGFCQAWFHCFPVHRKLEIEVLMQGD